MTSTAPREGRLPAIVQARLGSSRTPAKVLKSLGGRSLLSHVVDRLQSCERVCSVTVATTDQPCDDALVDWCNAHEIGCFRGSEDDVLARMIGAAESIGCDSFVRVCSDNPFLDPTALDVLIREYLDGRHDYATYVLDDGTPIIMKPVGVFAEVVRVAALRRVVAESDDPLDRQHVTMYIHQNPERFAIRRIVVPEQFDSDLRLTVDYPEDFQMCEEILKLSPGPTLGELLATLEVAPGLLAKNLSFSREHQKRYR